MQFFPLDSYTEKPVGLMEVVAGDPAVPVIWDTYREILNRYEPEHCEIEFIERFAFYERAKKAYAVIATGETAIYANVLASGGVLLNLSWFGVLLAGTGFRSVLRPCHAGRF
jgi:L-fucose mutarotase